MFKLLNERGTKNTCFILSTLRTPRHKTNVFNRSLCSNSVSPLDFPTSALIVIKRLHEFVFLNCTDIIYQDRFFLVWGTIKGYNDVFFTVINVITSSPGKSGNACVEIRLDYFIFVFFEINGFSIFNSLGWYFNSI